MFVHGCLILYNFLLLGHICIPESLILTIKQKKIYLKGRLELPTHTHKCIYLFLIENTFLNAGKGF
jgi:hypothetical protein